jgi:hypothetical protein
MSPILLYALVPADQASPSAGRDGGELSVVTEGSVAMLYEERTEAPAATQEELVGFGEVLSAISRERPTLPVRFGTVVADVAEVRELMRRREPEWRERLEAVAGHVEMVVHARDETAPKPAPATPGGGREYLTSRAAALRHTETMYDELAAALEPHCREQRRLPGTEELRLACLVPAGGTEALRAAVQAWSDAQGGRSTSTTGPWPAFSFTDEEAST